MCVRAFASQIIPYSLLCGSITARVNTSGNAEEFVIHKGEKTLNNTRNPSSSFSGKRFKFDPRDTYQSYTALLIHAHLHTQSEIVSFFVLCCVCVCVCVHRERSVLLLSFVAILHTFCWIVAAEVRRLKRNGAVVEFQSEE